MKTIEIIRLVLKIAHLIDVDALRKLVHDIEARDAGAVAADLLAMADKALAAAPSPTV